MYFSWVQSSLIPVPSLMASLVPRLKRNETKWWLVTGISELWTHEKYIIHYRYFPNNIVLAYYICYPYREYESSLAQRTPHPLLWRGWLGPWPQIIERTGRARHSVSCRLEIPPPRSPDIERCWDWVLLRANWYVRFYGGHEMWAGPLL